jgi:hypothetical protein
MRIGTGNAPQPQPQPTPPPTPGQHLRAVIEHVLGQLACGQLAPKGHVHGGTQGLRTQVQQGGAEMNRDNRTHRTPRAPKAETRRPPLVHVSVCLQGAGASAKPTGTPSVGRYLKHHNGRGGHGVWAKSVAAPSVQPPPRVLTVTSRPSNQRRQYPRHSPMSTAARKGCCFVLVAVAGVAAGIACLAK